VIDACILLMLIMCSINGETVWEGKGERESKEYEVIFFIKDVKEKQKEDIDTIKYVKSEQSVCLRPTKHVNMKIKSIEINQHIQNINTNISTNNISCSAS
jgi:hypothetical protein